MPAGAQYSVYRNATRAKSHIGAIPFQFATTSKDEDEYAHEQVHQRREASCFNHLLARHSATFLSLTRNFVSTSIHCELRVGPQIVRTWSITFGSVGLTIILYNTC